MIKIAFLGSGNMTSAIVTGLVEKKAFSPEAIFCTSRGSSGKKLAQETGIQFLRDFCELDGDVDVIILACKPQQLSGVSPSYNEAFSNRLLISILAGTSTRHLQMRFPNCRNIAVVMPNIATQVSASLTAYASQHPLSVYDRRLVEKIFLPLGVLFPILESQMDSFASLAGCAPAFIFEFILGLEHAAEKIGLPREHIPVWVREVVRGVSLLLEKSNKSPDELRNAIASSGGMTEAGLKILQDNKLSDLIAKTLQAARNRAFELKQ